MPAVVGCSRLEEGLAQARQIGLADADAGVLDRDRKVRAVAQRADGDAAAARRELDGIGNEVDQDLVEGAAVGRNDFRQIGAMRILSSMPASCALSASRSQQLSIAGGRRERLAA